MSLFLYACYYLLLLRWPSYQCKDYWSHFFSFNITSRNLSTPSCLWLSQLTAAQSPFNDIIINSASSKQQFSCLLWCRVSAVWCGKTWLTGWWWWHHRDTARWRGSGNDRSLTEHRKRNEVQCNRTRQLFLWRPDALATTVVYCCKSCKKMERTELFCIFHTNVYFYVFE